MASDNNEKDLWLTVGASLDSPKRDITVSVREDGDAVQMEFQTEGQELQGVRLSKQAFTVACSLAFEAFSRVKAEQLVRPHSVEIRVCEGKAPPPPPIVEGSKDGE